MTKIRKSPAAGEGPVGEPSRRTILVVDDEATIRNILVQVLRLQGYRVLGAMNGMDALRTIGETPDRIDLMVTDLMMPLMGGHELIARAADLRPELQFICLSAAVTGLSLDRGVLFMPKPFSLRAITQGVREVLGCALQKDRRTTG